jgi:hypothetical protein
MQFVARLHTPRQGANPLQLVQYATDMQSISKQATGMLAAEPIGAWVEVSERVEIPRIRFVKEKVNNEVGITQMACVASRDVARAAGTRKESGSPADAGEK